LVDSYEYSTPEAILEKAAIKREPPLINFHLLAITLVFTVSQIN